jgi:hypothetical protein
VISPERRLEEEREGALTDRDRCAVGPDRTRRTLKAK